MAHPFKQHAHKNDPKWLGRVDRACGGPIGRADGGEVASKDMQPTDPTISEDDVKTWGTPDNARNAARARDYAKRNPTSKEQEQDMMNQMGRNRGGRSK